MHNESMANILVRDLPSDTHAELTRRAHARGQSLQRYLTDELTRLAAQPSPDEYWDRVASRAGGRIGLEDAVAIIRTERDR